MAKDAWWQRWMPVIVAVIAFTGSALGTAVPRLWFTDEESTKRLLDARLSAYNDFLKGQVKLMEAGGLQEGSPAKEKALQEYSALIREARFRIALYGTRADIIAITDYFGKYFDSQPCVGSKEKWKDDIRFYQEIRKGIFRNDSDETVNDDRMILLLFNCRAPQ